MITSKRTGFTIVELLIVIVVIAILAAISIVAYNGIQERAKNTQTISSVKNIIKGLKTWYASEGVIPPGMECLYPPDLMPAGTTSCNPAWSGEQVYSESRLRQLEEFMGGKIQKSHYGGTPVGAMRYSRGWYSYNGDDKGVLVYVVGPGQSCGLRPLLAPGNWATTINWEGTHTYSAIAEVDKRLCVVKVF